MESIILDHIAVNFNKSIFYEKVRIKNISDYVKRINEIIDEGSKVAVPKAIYRPVTIEMRGENFIEADSVRFESKILYMNTENTNLIFPYALTCGKELDEWANSFEDLLDIYIADQVQEMICKLAIDELFKHIDENFNLNHASSMNPGSIEDWPISQQKNLFNLLGKNHKKIGIELLDSCLMKPIKSLSGVRFSNGNGFSNCRLCLKEKCSDRRTSYDETALIQYNLGEVK